jgi:hypothetical protein
LVKAHTILGKDGTGEVRTLLLKKMIVFPKMNYNGTSSLMEFKDTEGGTKVTWQSKVT